MKSNLKFDRQSGQVLIGVAFAMVVLAGFAGLAIDMGTLRYQKRLQQTAADAAALAGASELNQANGTTAWLPAAQAATNQNGFADTSDSLSACTPTAAVGTTCVFIQNPPKDWPFNGTSIPGGTHTGNSAYVEALVAKVQPTYFMTLLGFNSEVILARAVATNTGGGGAGPGLGCIVTLGTPTKQTNFNNAGAGATGNATFNGPTCGIADNGNLYAGGSVQVLAGSIGYGAGKGVYNPPSQQSPCVPGQMPAVGVCPQPVQMGAYTGDPLAGLYPSAPSLGAGSVTTTNGVTTYTPGSYSNISINGGNVVFQPGVYNISGSFTVNGNANICGGGTATFGATMTCTQDAAGDGVTFYMTGASSSYTGNGTSTTQMYAPNSGTYEALLYYQSPSSVTSTFNGNGTSFYQGVIYAPSALVRMGGNAGFNSGALYTSVVSDQYEIFGNTVVNMASNYSGLANGGGPLKGLLQWATLVE